MEVLRRQARELFARSRFEGGQLPLRSCPCMLQSTAAARSSCPLLPPADAAERYSQALALQPRDAQLHCNRCLALLRMAEFRDAAADASSAIQVG